MVRIYENWTHFQLNIIQGVDQFLNYLTPWAVFDRKSFKKSLKRGFLVLEYVSGGHEAISIIRQNGYRIRSNTIASLMYKYNSNRISFRFWFLSVWFEIENYSVSFSYLVISSKFYKLGHFWVQTFNQVKNLCWWFKFWGTIGSDIWNVLRYDSGLVCKKMVSRDNKARPSMESL